MRAFIAAAAAALSVSPAISANWVNIGRSSSGNNWDIDATSFGTLGNLRTAWFQSAKPAGVNQIVEIKEYVAFDCPARLSAIVSAIRYNMFGALTDSSSVPVAEVPNRLQPVVPESVSEMLLNAACSQR